MFMLFLLQGFAAVENGNAQDLNDNTVEREKLPLPEEVSALSTAEYQRKH
jgi:hypothetical protein